MGAWVPEKKRMGLVSFSELKYVCFRLWRHWGLADAQADLVITNASVVLRYWAKISGIPLPPNSLPPGQNDQFGRTPMYRNQSSHHVLIGRDFFRFSRKAQYLQRLRAVDRLIAARPIGTTRKTQMCTFPEPASSQRELGPHPKKASLI